MKETVCSICLEHLTDPVGLACPWTANSGMHKFCFGCIEKWMDDRKKEPTCPTCKAPIKEMHKLDASGNSVGEPIKVDATTESLHLEVRKAVLGALRQLATGLNNTAPTNATRR